MQTWNTVYNVDTNVVVCTLQSTAAQPLVLCRSTLKQAVCATILFPAPHAVLAGLFEQELREQRIWSKA